MFGKSQINQRIEYQVCTQFIYAWLAKNHAFCRNNTNFIHAQFPALFLRYFLSYQYSKYLQCLVNLTFFSLFQIMTKSTKIPYLLSRIRPWTLGARRKIGARSRRKRRSCAAGNPTIYSIWTRKNYLARECRHFPTMCENFKLICYEDH